MKVLRIIIIIVFAASIIAGCGQTDKQELEQQTTSPTTAPNPTRVPIPDVPHDEGFAYKDQFLGFITIIEGEGWDVEKYYEYREVIFVNENTNYDNHANTIFVISDTIIGDIDHLISKWWEDLSDHYGAQNVTTEEVEIGYDATETPMKGIEYAFQGNKLGEPVTVRLIFAEGDGYLYIISNEYNEEGEEVNMKAYETIKKTFIQCETFF